MVKAKFKPGDRVVEISFAVQHEGVAGTVISVEAEQTPLDPKYPSWIIEVILDTAERVSGRQNTWVTEEDYITRAYIPF